MVYFLTADGGTESLRARIYDISGNCLGSFSCPYETKFAAGGQAEQDPSSWWKSFVKASRGAIEEAKISGDQIVAVAYATTSCSVVALDENGDALRPAMIWMDVRASSEADAVLATGDTALEMNGNGAGPVSAEWMIPKALWLKRNEPQIFNKAHRICEYQDYLSYKLTGEWVASLNNVGLRWHYSTQRGGWATSLLKALDFEELQGKWPQRVVAPGKIIGTLRASAAEELGIPKTVKVIQGGADALIGMIGLGVAQPGQLALITGSSHLLFGVTDAPVHAHGVWGSYPDIVYPSRYIVEGGQTSTGSIINWLGRLTGGPLDFDSLNAMAEELEPGCDGLIVQDHFQGNRTPYTDAMSRGALVGLTLSHEKHHIFRAIMEGVGFGTRAILDAFTRAGYTNTEIIVGGGAAASRLWLQIHADTSGLPVRVPATPDAPSTGAAVLAAYGSEYFSSIDEGISAMVRPGVHVEPIKANVAKYEEIYGRYLALYPALKDVLSK
ncbi:MAG: carbohydrate kinase [Devosiaceae bacterium]|nr:carbohydrate kinase [Devosiaceae bacterium]